MSEDREKFVLAPVGRRQLFRLTSQALLAQPQTSVVGAAAALGAIALGSGCAQKQSGDRHDGHEQRHLQETAVHRCRDERTAAVVGCKDADGGGTEHESRRAVLSQPQRGPDHGREDEVVHGIGNAAAVVDEYCKTQHEHCQHQEHRLPEPVEAPLAACLVDPHEDKGSADEIAHGIADPPRGPR